MLGRYWEAEVRDAIWTSAAINFCFQNGIEHFFLAPGSRCTPLTLAVAEEQSSVVTQHFDERGLAFAALGYGRATGKPGVFICTSGTAVANAFPAVIEAAMEGVPLLLFTADRPDELRGSGANQTIDQRGIFGSYPRSFVQLPVPDDLAVDDDQQRVDYLTEKLNAALSASQYGPVHVNWMFREPFTISQDNLESIRATARVRSTDYLARDQPSSGSQSDCDTSRTQRSFELSGNTLIALGNCFPGEAEAALRLARKLNCPLVSDVTSGVGGGSFELPNQFELPRPQNILHLGGRIVSKSWFQWIASLDGPGLRLLHLTSTGQTINPVGADVEKVWMALDRVDERVSGEPSSNEFLKAWEKASHDRDSSIQNTLSKKTSLNEPQIARTISELCPADTGLFLGNSTPIRDMDWFGSRRPDQICHVQANRGASGIDGLLATATGYALGLQRMTTVVLGDLSALHDLNSLSLITTSRWPIIVVIINNQAGHIFDLLPIHRSPHFEQFFATPHRYTFGDAAKMFGISYQRLTDQQTLEVAYRRSLSEGKTVILELVTNRETNQEVRKAIATGISECRNQ